MIELTGEITSASIQETKDKLLAAAGEQEVKMVISSQGGLVLDALDLAEDFKRNRQAYPKRLETVGTTLVQSAAILIFLMGEKRYVGPQTEMTFHMVRGKLKEPCTIGEIEAVLMFLKEAERRYFQWIKSRMHNCPLTDVELQNLIMTERTLVGNQIVRLGFAHEVVGY